MDSEDETLYKYIWLIVDFLNGLYSEDEFIEKVKRLPKLTTPLPSQATPEGAHIWD